MALLKYADCAPLLNNKFKIRLADPVPEREGIDFGPTELTLELTEVEERNNEKCECFSLIFQGPAERFLPQKLYPISHDALGEHEIFIVPVGEKTEGENRKVVGYQYQAVFNRLKGSDESGV